MSIDVVVVNWNSGSQVRECIESIGRELESGLVTLTVVDNGSTDGSDAALETMGARVIRTGSNLGFARACNLGAIEGHSPYILFLNPDAVVYPGSLEYIVSYMDAAEHSRVAVCGVQLEEESGRIARSCTRFPTTFSFIAHALGVTRVFPSLGYFMTEWPHDNDRSIDHIIGAFYFIRREVFDSLGGFDERFFVYLEDLDLSRRVKNLGYSIEFLSGVQAFHKGGGTSDQVKAKRLFYSLRSRILYSFKHLGKLSGFSITIVTLFFEPCLRLAVAAVKGKGLSETLTAYRMLFYWLVQWVTKGTTR